MDQVQAFLCVSHSTFPEPWEVGTITLFPNSQTRSLRQRDGTACSICISAAGLWKGTLR